ncbi:manganese efflux pump MntP family protein [Methanobacterium sp.]|uniref:manganese efflux pump MntP n=1 Tax=Methanobacterium sp. TaxID=2164 RepID=UPI003C721CE1
MDIISIFLIAIGLAMDAFSVSITKGLVMKSNVKHALIIALFFGVFQALMPIGGWISGIQLEAFVSSAAPWIAFILLSIIGIKMIYDGIFDDDDDKDDTFSLKEVFFLAIATSIDAFLVGITFAFLKTPIVEPILIIGIVTFILSFIGFYIGKGIGHLFEHKIEILGGLILIGIGLKILLGF